jgi:carboxyl-terminal processing protease
MKQTEPKSRAAFIAALAAALICSQAVYGDQPSSPPSHKRFTDLARRIAEITDAVLEHHVDPPPRQEMVVRGIKALYKRAGLSVPMGLSRRVSSLATPEQLETILADVWPKTAAAPIEASKLEQAMLDGMLASVPGGARLVSGKEHRVEEQFKGNRYVGIHIALGMNDKEKRPAMSEVFAGGPADRAGAKLGDLIEQINGTDTKGMDLREVVDRLRGEDGTDVTIKVRQPKESKLRTMKITRGQLPHATISGVSKRPDGSWDVRLDGSAPIAYLRISEIASSTPHELRKLARQLEGQGHWGVVLDLRGLGGTSLHEAVLLADSLLSGGVIGRVRTGEREMTYQADSDAVFRTSPVAVLIDMTTSGTAEWLAAALQDNRRATLVGAPTMSAMYTIRPGAKQRADVRSMVQLGDGSWWIELATGRLEHGDGRPLSDESMVVSVDDQASRPRPVDPDKIKSGVKPDHMVGGNGAGAAARGTLPRSQRTPNHEPGTANDEVLREAVRLLRESLRRFI